MISQFSDLEKRIMATIRENKPMTIGELRGKLFGYAPPHEDFYHDLNYLMMYRNILKTVQRGKRSQLFECNPSTYKKHIREIGEEKEK